MMLAGSLHHCGRLPKIRNSDKQFYAEPQRALGRHPNPQLLERHVMGAVIGRMTRLHCSRRLVSECVPPSFKAIVEGGARNANFSSVRRTGRADSSTGHPDDLKPRR
jgi:hypothetical protein